MMPAIVFILCSLTSLTSAIMLARIYSKSRVRLLLWSSLCFFGLALNNILLFVDIVLLPNVDLWLWRACTALIGLGCLIVGLIWEVQ